MRDLVLITGGNGFLGSYVTRRLLRDGLAVRILDHHPTALIGGTEQADRIVGDVNDAADIRFALRDVRYLIHLACSSLPLEAARDYATGVQQTLVGDLRLFAEASRVGVEKIVFASSGGAVYGLPSSLPVSETAPTEPLSSYGILKLATEKYLSLYSRDKEMSFVVLRFGNLFGESQPQDRPFGVVTRFLHAALAGCPVEVWGEQRITKDYVHVEDAAEACLRAIRYSGAETIFNIGAGQGKSIADIIGAIGRLTGQPMSIVAKRGVRGDVCRIILDIRRANQELQWSARVSFEDGIERVWMDLQRTANRCQDLVHEL